MVSGLRESHLSESDGSGDLPIEDDIAFHTCIAESTSLSANVKRVENRIGYPIFDRSTKPLQLTEVGKHYVQAVEKVMDIENNLENYLLDLGNLKTGTLNVGGSNFFSSWILPPLIADFSQKFPHVQISLVEESTAKLSPNT